ncbi:MAG: hypothetical protein ACRCX2_09980 [Paraclostridium sp.]
MTIKRLASPKVNNAIATSKKVTTYTVNFTIKHRNKIKFIVCLALLVLNVGMVAQIPNLVYLTCPEALKTLAPIIIEKVIEIPVIY